MNKQLKDEIRKQLNEKSKVLVNEMLDKIQKDMVGKRISPMRKDFCNDYKTCNEQGMLELLHVLSFNLIVSSEAHAVCPYDLTDLFIKLLMDINEHARKAQSSLDAFDGDEHVGIC